jgi:hypothetical protein
MPKRKPPPPAKPQPESLTVGSPDIGAPALAQVHAFKIGEVTHKQVHDLDPVGITTGPPEMAWATEAPRATKADVLDEIFRNDLPRGSSAAWRESGMVKRSRRQSFATRKRSIRANRVHKNVAFSIRCQNNSDLLNQRQSDVRLSDCQIGT